jgi:hypothetical protein
MMLTHGVLAMSINGPSTSRPGSSPFPLDQSLFDLLELDTIVERKGIDQQ